jgi:uncharacterized protein DUF6111
MLRIALIDILLFLLPFLAYAAYMIWVKGVAPGNVMNTAPVYWLLAIGFGLLFAVTATLVQFSGGSREGTYHPPVIEDGVIRPGGVD